MFLQFPHHCVCIHEHTLAVLSESPTVQLCKRYPQVRTFHEGQVSRVSRVHHVHHTHLIENRLQRFSTNKPLSLDVLRGNRLNTA